MTVMRFETVEIDGVRALDALEEYRRDYPRTGMYPFLIGDREILNFLMKVVDDRSVQEIVEASMYIDVEGWLRERRRQAEEDHSFEESQCAGEWLGEASDKEGLTLHRDTLSGKPKHQVLIGLASLAKPWHLPAFTGYGGWNECPDAETHCAFFRYWQESFGAEIAGMSRDTIECVVEQPPTAESSATRLAWQQYWYCGDIVDQGTETVGALAGVLVNSRNWFFWWD